MSSNDLKVAKMLTLMKSGMGETKPHVRVSDGVIVATNMTQTIVLDGFEAQHIDCLVEVTDLIRAWDSTSQLRIVDQDEKFLQIKDGKFKAKLALISHDDYPIDPKIQPQGQAYSASGFAEMLDIIAPFLINDARAYLMAKHCYVTDGSTFLVRTPMEVEFPQDTQHPLTLERNPVSLLNSIEREPKEILISDDSFIVKYEGGYFENCRMNRPMEGDFASIFTRDMAKEDTMQELPPEVHAGLMTMVKFCTLDDEIKFSQSGIVMMQNQKVSYSIDHPMTKLNFPAPALKTIMGVANKFCFDNWRQIAFQGPSVEGFWSALP